MAEKEILKKLAQDLDEAKIQSKAQELASWIEGAVGDMAFEQYKMLEEGWGDPDMKARVERLRADGVTDIPGRLGDDLYNDAGVLGDLLGDRIYEAVSTLEERLALVKALKGLRTFTAWQEALDKLEQGWRERA